MPEIRAHDFVGTLVLRWPWLTQSSPSEEPRRSICKENCHPTESERKVNLTIPQFQEDHKVCRREAAALMHSPQIVPPAQEKVQSPTHFLIALKSSGGRKLTQSINSFPMIESLAQPVGGKPKNVRKHGSKYLTHAVKSPQNVLYYKITRIDKLQNNRWSTPVL